MKRNLTILKTVFLFLFAVFLLQGCRNETEATENAKANKEYKIIHQNYSIVRKNAILNQKFSTLESISSASKNNSAKQNNENIIEVDGIKIFKDYVTYVSPIAGSKETYSFYVENSNYRLAPNSVQNLVLSKKEDETDYTPYLVTYTFPEGINSGSRNYKISGIEKFNHISALKKASTGKNSSAAKTASDCIVSYTYDIVETKHKCYSGAHSGDSEAGACDGGGSLPYSTYVVKFVLLYADCGGSDGGGLIDGGSGGPGGGGSSGGSGPTVDTGISLPPTCQTGDCNEEILANKINTVLGMPLDYSELLWLNSNTDFAQGIWSMLSNSSTTETKNFAKWGIGFASANDTSWEQFKKWFIDGYSTQYQNNLTKLSSTQLQDFISINKEIDASPYEEDYIIESNEALVAFQVSGYLDNPTEANFQSAVNTLPCCAGMMLQRFISDRINNIAATYFYLRHLHPSWSKGKCFWNASQETIHLLLDVAGTVPVIGEVCDLTNGAIYAIQGDKLNASLSFAGAIPFAGWAATGAKFAIKTTATGAVIALVKNSSGFFVVSRNQKLFRKVLGMVAGDGRIAHHIIPFALQENSVIQKAILSKNAFMINEALNGIPVSSAVHAGSHTRYNDLVEFYLNKFNSNFPNATPEQSYNFVVDLINKINLAIKNNPNVKINDLNF